MINVHASLLPRYRGAAPVHRAVIAGDAETGVTIMRVVKALDAGPMLARAPTPIGADETSGDVERGLATLGADAAGRGRRRPRSGRAVEETRRTTRGDLRRTGSQGRRPDRLGRPARDVHNLVRGLQPWPLAFTFLDGAGCILHRSNASTLPDPAERARHRRATRTATRCSSRAATGTAIQILELQPEGKR